MLGLTAIAIFLLACTNIASLVVVRTAGRQAEFSVRTALGASAARLSRQLMIEHLVLAAIAAIASIGVVIGLRRLLTLGRLIPVEQLERATSGPAPILFLIALTMTTGLVLGWIVSRRAARTALTTGLRTQSAARETVRLRQMLVGVEVGAAVVLLLAAGLLLQSAARLIAVDPGFRSENVITFQVGLPMNRYMEPDARVRFIDGVVDQLASVPGVSAAASGAYSPMGSMRATRRFAIAGKPTPGAGQPSPSRSICRPGPTYAAVMGLRVIDGRWITERDRLDSPPVVVISESFARQHFPGRARRRPAPAVLQRPPDRPAAARAGDRRRRLRRAAVRHGRARSAADVCAARAARVDVHELLRAHRRRSAIGHRQLAGRRACRRSRIGRSSACARSTNLISDSTADRRALSGLLLMAAVVALLISTIGVYGVTAATTAARRRELAIRAAIGADRAGLVALVVRQGLIAAAIGVIAGSSARVAASSVLESVLFEVKARDPWTFADGRAWPAPAVCAIATYLPARRAVSGSPAHDAQRTGVIHS